MPAGESDATKGDAEVRESEATRARRQPDHEARRGAAKGGVERRLQSKKKKTESLRVDLRGPAMHGASKGYGKMREQTILVPVLGRAMTANEGAQASDDEHGAAEVVGPDGV